MISLNTMEQDEEKKKKMNDDVLVFMRKRSETEVPRYTARLKTYVDIQHKHARADAARRHSEHGFKKSNASRKKEPEQKQPAESTEPVQEEERLSRRGHTNEHNIHRGRSVSGSGLDFEPSDRGRRRSRRRRPRRTCCGRGCKRRRRRRPKRTCCGRGCKRRRRRRRSRRRRRKRRCGR